MVRFFILINIIVKSEHAVKPMDTELILETLELPQQSYTLYTKGHFFRVEHDLEQ